MNAVVVMRTSRVVIEWLGARSYRARAKGLNGVLSEFTGTAEGVNAELVRWHVNNVVAAPDDTWEATAKLAKLAAGERC